MVWDYATNSAIRLIAWELPFISYLTHRDWADTMYVQTLFDKINDNMDVNRGQIKKNCIEMLFAMRVKDLVLLKL